jgi:hypothetical protein
MPTLHLQDSTQIKFAIEQKSKRLQLNDALQDFFAVNPKTYHRPSADCEDDFEKDVFYPEESEESYPGAIDMSNSLDDTYHVSRFVKDDKSPSCAPKTFHSNTPTLDRAVHVRKSHNSGDDTLDATIHKERHFREPLPCTRSTTTRQQLPPQPDATSETSTARSGRRVTWKTDFDPSDGTIE